MKTIEETKPHFEELMAGMKSQFVDFARETAEKEWELMELKMFISSTGKERMDKVRRDVEELRRLEKEGKINLRQYDKLSNDF